jgi:hypothetical protein
MHVVKGFFECTIGLLLDIPSKTNDGLSAHNDFQALEIREELHQQERLNRKAYLPPVTTPSQLMRKGNTQVSAWDQSPPKILIKHKESSLHIRLEDEWL